MKTIKYEIDEKSVEIEVTEEFAAAYAEMEREDARIERRETRRTQSLDNSLDNGFDIPDESVDVEESAVKKDEITRLYAALEHLTAKQKQVLFLYAVNGLSFIEISKNLELNKDTVREHYSAAIKKLKKFLN